MANVTQQTVIFLGPQGSGKGTQINLLKEFITSQDPNSTIVHFEMGKNLRELATKDDYTGRSTAQILSGGNLIPFAISASVFTQYLVNHITRGDEHLITDGFPRTIDQIPMIDSAVEFFKRSLPTVVCINISDEEAVKRLVLRGRSDDTEEAIRKRLEWSRRDSMPAVDWFRNNPNYRVLDIDGQGIIEETHQKVMHALGLES